MGVERLELAAQVFKVVLIDCGCEQLLNDGQEIRQRTDRGQGRSLGRAEDTAGCGQQEGVFDGM